MYLKIILTFLSSEECQGLGAIIDVLIFLYGFAQAAQAGHV